jgi:uncharacterized cupin superfamily protein
LTERDAGFFVSRIDAEAWEHDQETGGLVHFVRADEGLQAGLWKPGDVANQPIELELVADETFLVLEGCGELRVDSGEGLELRPGMMVSLRKGARTSWLVDADFKEFWVYSSLG